jgi:hypothetical protein
MVDKVIALGLIDVRDIEEVGSGPLMEELALDEATADKVVELCAAEAKIVAVEQEAKKKADMAAKAADRAAFSGALAGDGGRSASADAGSSVNPLLGGLGGGGGASDESSSTMPGAMEATEGMAPEVSTHSEDANASGDELSVEEQAIQMPGSDQPMVEGGDAGRKDYADEEGETAALAEGRATPPAKSPDEPA